MASVYNQENARYVKDNEQYYNHQNILGSYAKYGRLAKMTREVDYSPLAMDKTFRPQVSNLYQYYTHVPGLRQGKHSYFTLDKAYGRH